MMARRPRPGAAAPYSAMSRGMRCAEITWASQGTPKSRSIETACCMTSQSLEEPMTTPTTGAGAPALAFEAGREDCTDFDLALPTAGFAVETVLAIE
jgi:hypothetical protein